MSAWDWVSTQINNTGLAQGLSNALQQYGYNRQQGVPLGRGGTGNSVYQAMTTGLVGPAQAYSEIETGGGGGGGGGGAGGGDYVAPKPEPAPSGINRMDRNANPGDGWFWDAADGWKQEGSSEGSSGGSSQPNLLDMINSEFDSILGGLGGQQSQEQGFIGNAQNLQRQGINEQLGFGINNLNTQRDQVRSNQANTLADLSKSLRDTSRNTQMMLGARGATGSANDAASYALTKLYGNQRAGVQQQTLGQLNEIATAENNLKASAASMLNDVDTWANSMMADIASRYNSLRQNIGTMKASARLEEVARLQAEASTIRQMQQQYAQQVQQAAQARLMQLNDYKTQLSGMSQYTPEQQTFQEFNFNPSSYQADQGFDPSMFNPLARRKKDLNR